jgi:hypothetical protein
MSTWIFQTYPKEKASTLYGYLLTCGVFIIFFLYFINYSIVYFLNNNYLWPGLIIVILFFYLGIITVCVKYYFHFDNWKKQELIK